MSNKHFFHETNGLVQLALQSLVARTPHLGLDEPHKVVFDKSHDPSKVTVISGGGSGHEPGWSGYVGDGMLSAAVAGDIFASPSTKQVMAAINNAPSSAGVILCITNYTGDILHFGLATEKATAAGQNVSQIPLSDDVSLPRHQTQNTGRRGLAGNVLVLKLLGAAAAASWSFDDCTKLGLETNASIASIGTSLDLCHVMGRPDQESVAKDTCVLGMGVHNEPGLRAISPIPNPGELIKEMLSYALDREDSDRNFVQFDSKDETCLLINNLGGIANLELEGLTKITLDKLFQEYSIVPSRIYAGAFETSLNAPGFSISLCNLSQVAKSTSRPLSRILDLLDAPTSAPAWPKNQYNATATPYQNGDLAGATSAPAAAVAGDASRTLASEKLLPAIKAACEAAIAAEPFITKFDTVMGDGDCGEGVVMACEALLSRFDSTPFTESKLELFPALNAINDTLEDMGGSLFAILSILLTAFVGCLKKTPTATKANVGTAAGEAINRLFAYTGARVGDRTVMDVLIPLCETLEKTRGNLLGAVEVAEARAQATAAMKPRFGRATYVGEDVSSSNEKPPDPGAYALSVWLRAFLREWTI